tara:strand:- start:2165 stop:2869 length:705 start_codon:yes stop_codon:yes gene_type:complete
MKNIKLITFDLDDTFWDIGPVIIKAELETREWLQEKVGDIQWGSLSDFLNYRKELIKENNSLEWDISLLRKEIYRRKLDEVVMDKIKRDSIINEAYQNFIDKRHEVTFYEGVFDAIKHLSKKYHLGVLTNGNADIFRFDIGKFFDFSISSLDVKSNKPAEPHFKKALENYKNISYNQILHVGDRQINDIYGAHILGINTLWFNNKNVKWNLEIAEPNKFNNWKECVSLIEDIYE